MGLSKSKKLNMAYSVGTYWTKNDKKHIWPHRWKVIVCEAMYVVFHSNFAAYIVGWLCKPCEFCGFVEPDYCGKKSYYIIICLVNRL